MDIGEVSQQLINPTDVELQHMDEGIPPKFSPGAQQALHLAQGWIGQLVTNDSQPPPGVVFYPFKGDGTDRCDIIRVHYPTLKGDVEIAQTFCVFSLIVHWPKPEEGALFDHVMQVGKCFLKETERLDLQIVSEENGIMVGRQATQQPPPEHTDFIYHLRWWTDGKRVGFVTLKKGKHPGRAVMSWDKGFNLNWFSLYEE